jgi:signal transduction histidine kinase
VLASTHRKAQDTARSVALYNEATIQSIRHVLIGLGTMLPQFETDRALCAEVVGRLDGYFGGRTVFGAFGADGRPLCGAPEVVADVAAGHNETVESLPLPGASGAAVFRIARPAGGSALRLVEPVTIDERIVGSVAASVSLGWLNREIGRYPLEASTAIMLVDQAGYVLARRPDPGCWLGRPIRDQILEDLRPRREGTREIVGPDSRRRIAALAAVPSFPDRLFVLIGLDQDTALAAVNQATLHGAVILGLIALAILATAIATWETAGTLIRRERSLSEGKAAAERVAANQQRIADTIGHDLRNSVQTLVSFLRNLRRNSGRPPDPAMIPYVARAIGDLRSSLDILIRASRLESGAFEAQTRTVHLATFLKKIANDWQFYAETKGIRLTVTATAETVDTDPDLLRTIVSNLVSNAIKHTDSGSVAISAAADPDGRVDISIRDTGNGIPPGKADIIFEAFSRLEPEKTEGLGLGLSIVKRSADLLGCEIVLDRGTESGCRFIVRLPRANGAHARSGRAPRPD